MRDFKLPANFFNQFESDDFSVRSVERTSEGTRGLRPIAVNSFSGTLSRGDWGWAEQDNWVGKF